MNDSKGPAIAKSGRASSNPKRVLRGVSDIRRFFHRNDTPVYFISATNFNLIGIDEWVRNFRYINYIDCFDGHHPHVFVPQETPHRPFTCIEEINNYLLEHKEVVDYVKGRREGGKALFLFFDEQTEALCKELGLELCFPPDTLRRMVDDKISATRIANRAGVESVPNVLAKAQSLRAAPGGRSGSRRGPGRPNGVRRLRAHDLLHLERGRLERARRRDRGRARSEDHEAVAGAVGRRTRLA